MKQIKKVKTDTVFQMEMTECGAASLSMVMNYYGVNVPLEQLRIDTGVSRDGCKASKILLGARKHGFNCKGVKVGLKGLLNMVPPCIIHWNFNHFLVYEGVVRDRVYLNDPAEGHRIVSVDELDKSFTGIVLDIKATENITKSKNKKTFVSLLKNMIGGELKNILFFMIIGLFISIPGVLIPIISQFYIDNILLTENFEVAYGTLIILFGMILFKTSYTYYRNKMLMKLQNKLALVTTYSFLKHLFRTPIEFFSQRYYGDIANRVENNNNVCEFVAGDLTETTMNILLSLIYIVAMYAYSPILTFMCIIMIAINLFFIKMISDKISQSISKVQQDKSKLVGAVYTGVSIIDSIIASGVENQYVSRILGYYSKVINGQQRQDRIQVISSSIPNVTKVVSEILIIIVGGSTVIKGDCTIGVIVAFVAIFQILIEPITQIAKFIENFQKVSVDMDRIDDIMNQNVDPKFAVSDDDQHDIRKLEGEITIKDLEFGYSKLEEPLIHKFDFHLSCGKSIALVGGSGSGKSTVAKIISGLYAPWDGEILFDGSPYNSIHTQTKNISIATVNQEIFIFRGTIKDNITMWNKTIREEDILRAAKDAEIHDMITKKTEAYDYLLDERGSNLSGGQRQRIEIARALVNNPSIIIMDEATSALDALTERNIIDNIKKRGCTTIIVAHRLSAIRDCDEIIVMEKGKIIERGTHLELIEDRGRYFQMFGEEQ